MSVFPLSLPRLFAELKRRKVFRVMAVYGATSFVVLQAAELMLPRLGLPDWTVTFLVVLVVLAFPVVLIIAWAFPLLGIPCSLSVSEILRLAEVNSLTCRSRNSWSSGHRSCRCHMLLALIS